MSSLMKIGIGALLCAPVVQTSFADNVGLGRPQRGCPASALPMPGLAWPAEKETVVAGDRRLGCLVHPSEGKMTV